MDTAGTDPLSRLVAVEEGERRRERWVGRSVPPFACRDSVRNSEGTNSSRPQQGCSYPSMRSTLEGPHNGRRFLPPDLGIVICDRAKRAQRGRERPPSQTRRGPCRLARRVAHALAAQVSGHVACARSCRAVHERCGARIEAVRQRVNTRSSHGAPIRFGTRATRRIDRRVPVSRETFDKLRRVQDLLRHRIPDGDPAAIFDRALTVLLKELERTKFASTERPRLHHRSALRSRNIPAAVRREVWERDGGRCAFAGAAGRCTEMGFLEFHHDRIKARCQNARLLGPLRELDLQRLHLSLGERQ